MYEWSDCLGRGHELGVFGVGDVASVNQRERGGALEPEEL